VVWIGVGGGGGEQAQPPSIFAAGNCPPSLGMPRHLPDPPRWASLDGPGRDLEAARQLVQTFQQFYPERLHTALVVAPSKLFLAAWKVRDPLF